MTNTIDLKPIGRILLCDVLKGVFESSPELRGNWKQYWTMKLMRENSRAKLPRGFSLNSSQMKKEYVDLALN